MRLRRRNILAKSVLSATVAVASVLLATSPAGAQDAISIGEINFTPVALCPTAAGGAPAALLGYQLEQQNTLNSDGSVTTTWEQSIVDSWSWRAHIRDHYHDYEARIARERAAELRRQAAAVPANTPDRGDVVKSFTDLAAVYEADAREYIARGNAYVDDVVTGGPRVATCASDVKCYTYQTSFSDASDRTQTGTVPAGCYRVTSDDADWSYFVER